MFMRTNHTHAHFFALISRFVQRPEPPCIPQQSILGLDTHARKLLSARL